MKKKINIGIFGLGYVGLSNTILFSKEANVSGYDIDKKKIKILKNNKSPIQDKEIEHFFANNPKNIFFDIKSPSSYLEKDLIFVCTPTNFDEKISQLDTKKVESIISETVKYNKDAIIIIKSTVPIGFTKSMQVKFNTKKIIFSPEFLREGYALYDNLYPSRIILGGDKKFTRQISQLMTKCALKKKISKFFMSTAEAEATKLFSNTYLAMRIAFFNELDTFSYVNKLNTENIIRGVSSDHRIGDYYNNPSFGYGGYCLPKDSKQLLTNFSIVPQKIIRAVISSNNQRKKFIASMIKKKKPKVVGIYRMTMKLNSDNYRESSIRDIIRYLTDFNIEIVIYEPLINQKKFENCLVINNLNQFKKISSMIISNRNDENLMDVKEKLFTRDVFNEN